jgi:Ca2+-transporting ATPase
VWIAFVILLGQIAIVTFAGDIFHVSALSVTDWLWILLLTSPVLVFPDVVRYIENIVKKAR